MKIHHLLFFCLAFIGLNSFSGCNNGSDDPAPIVKEQFTLTFKHLYNTNPLEYHTVYQSAQGNPIWFTQKKYYISNVVAIKSDQTKHFIADVLLVHPQEDNYDVSFTSQLPKGDYIKIIFDLGVRQDLNEQDPATYNNDHPLSVMNNMYWTWSTQYIFSRLEGFEVSGNDTINIAYHAGLEELYRPNVEIDMSFMVSHGGGEAIIGVDLFEIFKGDDYTFNFTEDSQTHTMDNLELAAQYMDNFSNSFP